MGLVTMATGAFVDANSLLPVSHGRRMLSALFLVRVMSDSLSACWRRPNPVLNLKKVPARWPVPEAYQCRW